MNRWLVLSKTYSQAHPMEISAPIGKQPLDPELASASVAKHTPKWVSSERGKVVANIMFYRSNPEYLRRAVLSLKGRCDGVVALDGVYRGLSDVVHSPADNYHAIMDAAREIGICVCLYGGQEYTGEPHKRNAGYKAALTCARRWWPGEDYWLLPIDSDEWLLSDIDWELVLADGQGSGRIIDHRDGVEQPDLGVTMVRLYPLTDTLMCGPAHFDVRDAAIPKTYVGWEKALQNDDEPAFRLGHEVGARKLIHDEYETYNDTMRVRSEGKVMRVVENYEDGDRILIRIDKESAMSQNWEEGMFMQFAANLIGQDEGGMAEIVSIEETAGIPECFDVEFERLEPGDESRVHAWHAKMATREEDRRAKLMRRMKKRARRADRDLGRVDRGKGRE